MGAVEATVAQETGGGLGETSMFWVVVAAAATVAIVAAAWYATRGPKIERG